MDPPRKAIGIVRVSVKGQRDEDRFFSPEEQRERIEAVCQRDGLRLVAVHEEIDVSGGKSLEQRKGLMAAVHLIEQGRAQVLAAAYFDRLFRSLATQAEVVERVEKAGGVVLAVDVGEVSAKSAATWLSGTMMGAVSEYYRRSAKERSAAGQAKAVARGKAPWARVPLGYTRTAGGNYEPNPDEIPIVRRVFEMRLEGASYLTIRRWLAGRGVQRSPRGVQVMLHNRAYLGELHFGKLTNLRAHEPIIDRDVFNRVARMQIPRGPQASSDRLLARLRIMRCGSCGSVLGTAKVSNQDNYPIYRCASPDACARQVTISAEIAERAVWEAVKAKLSDASGRANAAVRSREIIEQRDRAQAALERAIRSLSGMMDEPASVETLGALRAERDRWQQEVDELPPELASVMGVGDHLGLRDKRALIAAVIDRVDVAPSGPFLPKGEARLSIKFRIE